VADLGAYTSFTDERGNALPWLQRVDTVSVNSVHAIVVRPTLVRIEMLRVERTYDLLTQPTNNDSRTETATGKFHPVLWAP